MKSREETVILAVDDDPDITTAMLIALRPEGYRVITANNGQEGLELARKHVPDLVILDVEMPPGMQGWEVCRLLRDDPVTADIPVLFLTARLSIEAMEETFEGEAQGFVQKPLSAIDLVSRIEKALSEAAEQEPS